MKNMILIYTTLLSLYTIGLNAQPVLKVGFYTTDQVATAAVTTRLNAQVANAQTVMNNTFSGSPTSAIPDIEILQQGHENLRLKSAITQDDPLVIPSMSLVYNYLSNYVQNAEYLFQRSSTSVESWGINVNEVNTNLVSSLRGDLDISVFIVEDDFDGDDIHLIDHALENFTDKGRSYNNSLIALIKRRKFIEEPFALAIAIFGLLGDRDDSHASTNNINSSLLSYLSYYYYYPDNFDLGNYSTNSQLLNILRSTWNPSRLSAINICNVKKSLNTLRLKSADIVGISNGVNGGKREFAATNAVLILPDEEGASQLGSAKRFRTSQTGDYLVFNTNYQTEVAPLSGSCPISNGLNTSNRLAAQATTDDPAVEIETDTETEQEGRQIAPLTLYPNPFTNTFKVVYEQAAERASDKVVARVYDFSGRTVMVKRFAVRATAGIQELEIDGSELPVGPYIIEIDNGVAKPQRATLIRR